MDLVNAASTVSVKMLDELRNLRKDAAEMDAHIARLEMYIENCCNAADVLQKCYIRRSQMEVAIRAVEYKINCEIIRGVHLICA